MMYPEASNGAQDLPSGSCPQCPEIKRELSTDMDNSVCLTEDILALGRYNKQKKYTLRKQESISAGCVPAACQPYPAVSQVQVSEFGGGGRLKGVST